MPIFETINKVANSKEHLKDLKHDAISEIKRRFKEATPLGKLWVFIQLVFPYFAIAFIIYLIIKVIKYIL